MVATNVVHLGILDQAPDLGLLQVIKSVVVGSTQIRAHAPVVACNHHTAPARRLRRLDAVLDTKTSLLDGILQDGGVLVVADTAEVYDAVVGQEVLGAAGGVLGSAASNELGIVVVEELLVERLVGVLGEDGVVGLQVVLGEELIAAEGLDVCKGRERGAVSKSLFHRAGESYSVVDQGSFRELTEERILQSQETEFFSSSHFVQLRWSISC